MCVFHCLAGLWLSGKRDYLPVRATVNAQSARHGARPGPKLAPSVQAAPLRAPQPRAREKTRGRNTKGGRCAKETAHVTIKMYKMVFCSGKQNFSLPDAGLFSRCRLRGTQGGRLYTTAQVWIQAGLRGACSGRSKSRNLGSNHGVAFRGARAERDNGKPTYQLFRSIAVKRAATQQQQSLKAFLGRTATDTTMLACVDHFFARVDHYFGCVVMMYACTCFVCSDYVCAGLSMCVLQAVALGRPSFRTVVVSWDEHVRTCKHIFTFIFAAQRCLHFVHRYATHRHGQFYSTPSLTIAQIQALLGHNSSSSSSTSTSTNESADLQQQHQQLLLG